MFEGVGLALVAAPSLDLRREDLRLDESRGGCCGDASAEVSEDGLLVSVLLLSEGWRGATDPALDIAAFAAFFFPLLGASRGSGAAASGDGLGSGMVPPRARLVLRCSRSAGGEGWAVALRLRGAGAVLVVGEGGSVVSMLSAGAAFAVLRVTRLL